MHATLMTRMPTAERSVACAKLSQALVRLADGLRLRLRNRRDLAQVSVFDDRALADIGLSRSDVDRAVRFGHAVDEMRGLTFSARAPVRSGAPAAD